MAPTRYIHLRNTNMHNAGSFWRGRLADVSGWFPGPTVLHED